MANESFSNKYVPKIACRGCGRSLSKIEVIERDTLDPTQGIALCNHCGIMSKIPLDGRLDWEDKDIKTIK